MASYKLLALVNGKQTGEPSSTLTLDLTAVRIGTDLLTISDVSNAFDFGNKNLSNVAAATANGQVVEFAQYTAALALKVSTSAVGANNGVASLDSAGKIPLTQLPASVLEYKGTYNASTNTPALADGTGVSGYFYRVSVAGTVNFGSGAISFVIGDWVMYNGSVWQQAHSGSDLVQSVNGLTGAVVLTTDTVTEGTTNLYYTTARFNTAFAGKTTDGLTEGTTNLYYTTARFNTAFAGKTTDGLTEGTTNLYFTNARAQTAAVANVITAGVTNVAPSEDAVFQALALKANAATTPSLIEGSLQNNQGAGTAITVRQAVFLSAAGQVQLAVATNTNLSFWTKYRMVSDASIADQATGNFYRPGATVSGFTGLTFGAPIYLSHATAGGYVQDLSTFVAGDQIVSLGQVISATAIEFNPQWLYTF